MPEISVIVPVYKTEEYLDQCVQSILAQTFTDLEVILVDDGSPDHCGEMCEQYAAQDSRVKVIYQENQGLSAARNAGIAVASGEYIGFVDSDDWVHPEIYRLLYHDVVNTGSLIASCGIQKVHGGEDIVVLQKTTPVVTSGTYALSNILRCTAPEGHTAWNRLYKRELFRDIQFPVGRLYEDAFTIPLLYVKASTASYRSDALYYYRQRAGSIMTRSYDRRSMDKLDAAEHVLSHIHKHAPHLERDAVCFRTVSILRLLVDMLSANRSCFLEGYPRIEGLLSGWDIIGNSRLTIRHRMLLALYFISPGLYLKLWQKHLM